LRASDSEFLPGDLLLEFAIKVELLALASPNIFHRIILAGFSHSTRTVDSIPRKQPVCGCTLNADGNAALTSPFRAAALSTARTRRLFTLVAALAAL
jgi:hypothetical protein